MSTYLKYRIFVNQSVSMKKNVVSFILFFTVLFAYSQKYSDFQLSASVSYKLNDYIITYGGIGMELPITEHWALNYNLKVGYSSQQTWYVNSDAGLLLAPLMFANTSAWEVFLLALFIPEGVTYNIDIGENARISPYLNTFAFEVDFKDDFFPAMECGIKLKKYHKHFFISPHMGVKYLVFKNEYFIDAGISVGLYRKNN